MRGSGGLSELGVRRPILILVCNLLIALAGLAALRAVEVRELPDVDVPIVSVRAQYPGASPETMDSEVTRILEGAVARVSGVHRIDSSSEENSARIHVEFRPGINLDTAASDVREAVSRVQRDLPDDVEQLTVVKAEQDAEPVILLAAVSDTLQLEELTARVEREIVPELIGVPGVADVPLFGNRQRILRIVVDPLRLTSHGLSISDLAQVLGSAAFDVPAGSFTSTDQRLLIRADASTVTEEAVEDLIVRGSTRIGDVARAYFGPEDAESLVSFGNRTVVGLGVVRQAGSNTIDISDGVSAAVERVNARYDDLELSVVNDGATFIRSAVAEVLGTLILAVLIVIGTIWLFMGSWRTTLIPSVSIPIGLIGTVAAIWLFGFSINILTLLALVLVTGLIVDDAIVVLENIQRKRSQGMMPRGAAVLGAKQVFFAVLATTAVLISVFLPIALLPGTAGRLFREFGVVLAVAVAISSFVALSLVPALAARLPMHDGPPGALRQRLNSFGMRLATLYRAVLQRVLQFPLTTFAVCVGLATALGLLYHALDQELLPAEDRGVIYVDATGPDGVGLAYGERQAERIEAALRPLVDSGEVETLFTIVGRYDPNRVRVVARLAPWDDARRSQQTLVAELERELAGLPGANVRITSTNSLNLRRAGSGLQFALTGNEYSEIHAAAQVFAAAMEDRIPQLRQPRISYQLSQPQLSLDVDRRRAAELGINLDGLAVMLRAMIGGYEVVDLTVGDEAVPIVVESAAGELDDPSDLANLYVAAADGGLLPLSSIVSLREEGVAAELGRHAQRRAIEIDSQLANGYALQSAVDDVRRLADELLPPGIGLVFLGEAATMEETSQEVGLTYAIALLVVFLVLSAQFESWTSAAVVTVTVPFGIAAAILALFLTGTSVNIYSQIGLVMLIGLMAKNGILLVEFADQLRERGLTVREAVLQAAEVRLRPIAMTMLSTVLGGLPLILGSGAGAEARSAIGWVIFGGLGIAALFTLFLTPVVYLGLAPLSRPRSAEAARLESELSQAKALSDH